MTFRWNEDTMLKFVHLYKSHACLWDSKITCYKNNVRRTKALDELVKEMNVTDFGVMECKNKIKNLRSAYCQELKKIKRSNYNYTPTVVWFNLLDSFLRNYINHSRDTSSVSFQEKFESDTEGVNTSSTPKRTQNPKIELFSGDNEDSIHQFLQPKMAKFDDSNNSKEITTCSISDALQATSSNNNATAHTIAEESVTTFTTATYEENEFDTFSRNVAAQLKRMPLRRALQTQLKIQTILTEMRLMDD